MTNGEHKYFRPAANAVARLVIVGTVAVLLVVSVVTFEIFKSPFVTRAGIVEPQPVPFSHKHHVTDDGIDCRYCHTTVERSAFAGMPSTETCMNCHSQIWTTSEMLEPVRASFGRASRCIGHVCTTFSSSYISITRSMLQKVSARDLSWARGSDVLNVPGRR